MNRIEIEAQALQRFRKIIEQYDNGELTKKDFDRQIDCIVYEVFTALDLIPLRETFYRYKIFASESWPDNLGVVGMYANES